MKSPVLMYAPRLVSVLVLRLALVLVLDLRLMLVLDLRLVLALVVTLVDVVVLVLVLPLHLDRLFLLLVIPLFLETAPLAVSLLTETSSNGGEVAVSFFVVTVKLEHGEN